jgi:hypothetical protein
MFRDVFPLSRGSMTSTTEDRLMHAVRVEFTPDEANALKHALESYLSDLRMEIVDTDSQDFRDGLKNEKHLLEAVVIKIKG